ncbi:ABC-2 family transporter [Natranaerovirga hydrolytica]|uniref:ABC-2 family transporter n=1 Tax=Natranaerovirga hydrolytica TaxID=680378 RepID=A0A4R1MZE7_9FIRM|nr:ABC-2 transporter permease [Natranaerovirga hydrolytica]TCK98555.1 ABC-2 family transporter [Natranaerovirga hydrolytica]
MLKIIRFHFKMNQIILNSLLITLILVTLNVIMPDYDTNFVLLWPVVYLSFYNIFSNSKEEKHKLLLSIPIQRKDIIKGTFITNLLSTLLVQTLVFSSVYLVDLLLYQTLNFYELFFGYISFLMVLLVVVPFTESISVNNKHNAIFIFILGFITFFPLIITLVLPIDRLGYLNFFMKYMAFIIIGTVLLGIISNYLFYKLALRRYYKCEY